MSGDSPTSPLAWNLFFDKKEVLIVNNEVFNIYRKGSSGPLFYLLHGGGYTALTWALLVNKICAKIECQILAPDLRGHGETSANDRDLSIDQLVSDVCNIYTLSLDQTSKPPPLILVGHSLGGALAIRALHRKIFFNVQLLVIIDVVEGSAISSINFIQKFLKSRPQKFASVEKAIEWCLKSGTTKNLQAARVSMPSRIILDPDKNTNKGFVWRTDLLKTSSYWGDWFIGISNLFLQCDSAKLLILANIDRLDKELLIGQMRGMFQLEVLPNVGHAIHEDSPDLVADILVNIITRYKALFK